MRISSGERSRSAITTKTVVIILAVVGVFGLLGISACAGIFVYFAFNMAAKDFPAARAVSEGFLNDIGSNQTEAAYSRTTKAFQGQITMDEFNAMLDRFPVFKTHTSRTYGNIKVFHSPGGKQAGINVTLFTMDNAMSCTLVLVQEEGNWRVQKLNVP